MNLLWLFKGAVGGSLKNLLEIYFSENFTRQYIRILCTKIYILTKGGIGEYKQLPHKPVIMIVDGYLLCFFIDANVRLA